MFTAYIIKKRYMLIIDGHDVYEIDEECIKKHRVTGECKVIEKLKEKEQRRQKKSFPPKKETPLPFPQQQHSNRIIHKIEEHPHPLSVLLHEQFVAAKSLISDLQ